MNILSKISVLLFLLAIPILFNSCIKEEFDPNKLDTEFVVNPSVAAPLGYIHYELDEILKDPTRSWEILVDEDSLISLMVIILDNAVKYSPDKSKISIKSEKDNGMVKIMIKDRGIGIDEKDLSHIFDRFFRADSARSRQDAGGYGLGLPIAQKIVERHNGTIQIESKIGHGTSINIRLPIKRYSDHA